MSKTRKNKRGGKNTKKAQFRKTLRDIALAAAAFATTEYIKRRMTKKHKESKKHRKHRKH